MCIIIYQPEGELIPHEHALESSINNPDGMGMLWAQNSELKVYKELKDFNKFYAKYLEVQVTGAPVLMHYRIGTSGKKNLKNCHPFLINKELGFCHNGVINIPNEQESKYSDTVTFNREVLQKLPGNFLDSDHLWDVVNKYIGTTYNKLAFMDIDGNVWLMNENLGHWDGSLWYSNKGYLPKPIYTPIKAIKPYKQAYKPNYDYYDTSREDIEELEDRFGYCDDCREPLITEEERLEGVCSYCSATSYHSNQINYGDYS